MPLNKNIAFSVLCIVFKLDVHLDALRCDSVPINKHVELIFSVDTSLIVLHYASMLYSGKMEKNTGKNSAQCGHKNDRKCVSIDCKNLGETI